VIIADCWPEIAKTAAIEAQRRPTKAAMSRDNPQRGPSVRGIPEGDNRERMICAECGYVLYDNPKIVVGSVARWGDKILLVRRSIEPRYGYWTLPAGYLELNESASAGAEREAWEEARARIEIEGLLAIYDIPRISQVQLIYRARLLDEAIQPGSESLEVKLFDWEEVPWNELAFPSIGWALQHDREARATRDFTARINPPGF
jgi:ADP-ribose pyrophosphatase YjhB (NUDIX family)